MVVFQHYPFFIARREAGFAQAHLRKAKIIERNSKRKKTKVQERF
jgi:hypothetical protein